MNIFLPMVWISTTTFSGLSFLSSKAGMTPSNSQDILKVWAQTGWLKNIPHKTAAEMCA
jgi:hypothetical protein